MIFQESIRLANLDHTHSKWVGDSRPYFTHQIYCNDWVSIWMNVLEIGNASVHDAITSATTTDDDITVYVHLLKNDSLMNFAISSSPRQSFQLASIMNFCNGEMNYWENRGNNYRTFFRCHPRLWQYTGHGSLWTMFVQQIDRIPYNLTGPV